MKKNEKYKVALLINKEMASRVIPKEEIAFLETWANFQDPQELPDTMTVDYMKERIKDADACITCWGTPCLEEQVLAEAPGLKLIAHAAGSVRPIVSNTVWERNIRVTSSAPIIATDVAETTLGLILVSLKRIWQHTTLTKSGQWYVKEEVNQMKRLRGLTVGVIGASHCGRNVINLLKPFGVSILLYDPLVMEKQAKELGTTKVTLECLMSESDVVTLHAPNLPENQQMINKDNLSLLKDGAVFINTARGALVDEEALISQLKTGRIFACIDVTDPEPPASDNLLRQMENVILTPHIAGGHTVNGRYEQGRFIIHQVHKLLTEDLLDYEVTKEMLEFIA